MFVTVPSNVDYLIDDLRLYLGDLDGSEYSKTIVRTSLLNGVKYLMPKWNKKYLIYTEDMLVASGVLRGPDGNVILSYQPNEYDVFRNSYATFYSERPPDIEQQDEAAILLAAAIILRKSKLTSNNPGFTWTTPDLSYSNIEQSRMGRLLIQQDVDALNAFFKFRLGKLLIGRLRANTERDYSVVDDINWIKRKTNETTL
jgi:hypothetical protein